MFDLNFILFLTICCLVIAVQAGDVNYDYFYEKTEPLKDDDTFLSYKIDVEKTDTSKFKIKGNIDQLQDTTDDMEFDLTSFHSDEKDGEMVETKFKGRKKLCDFMKGPYKSIIYPKFKDTSNVPSPDTCPLPKENYVINETEMDIDRFKTFLKPGYWKIILKLFKAEEFITGVAVYGNILEK